MALNVAAMLIAFIALVAMLNWTLAQLPPVGDEPLSLERMLGWVMAPLAWIGGKPVRHQYGISDRFTSVRCGDTFVYQKLRRASAP